jgi:hypothetical protein
VDEIPVCPTKQLSLHSVWDMVKPNFECPPESVNKALLDLAFNGLCIRKALDDWYSTFLEWLSENSSPNPDLQATLAIIYYHAISIFLSGIFDYHSQFNQMRTPTLSQPLIETHVSAILSGTKDALNLTNLGGLLFLFPLRVVGARTTFLEQNAAIITMLREISKRSFVVADSISSDLDELWRLKGI